MLFTSTNTKAQLKVIANGNVGLGVNSPQGKLHINDVLLLGPKTGVSYSEGIKFTRSQNYPTAPAEWAFDTDGSGFNIWKPYPSTNYGNFKLYIKDANSFVGINTGNPSYRLDVNGTLRCYGFTNSSDERLKSNIKDITKSLDLILRLNPKMYDLTIPANDQSTSQKVLPNGQRYTNEEPEILKEQAGLLAQEVNEILPNLVSEDNVGYLSINYIGLIPYLIDAIKEQNYEILALKSQLDMCCTHNSIGAENNETHKKKITENTPNTFAFLEQNNPNPFTQQTLIGYTIPENCTNSSIHIYDLNGVELKSYPINQYGKGYLTIQANSLKAGMYLYTLICEGKEIATKKMILTGN